LISRGGAGDMRRFGWVALALVFLTLAAPAALAEKRIALLIGNEDYKPGVGALVNPLNDVRVLEEALKAVGFEVLKPISTNPPRCCRRRGSDSSRQLKRSCAGVIEEADKTKLIRRQGLHVNLPFLVAHCHGSILSKSAPLARSSNRLGNGGDHGC